MIVELAKKYETAEDQLKEFIKLSSTMETVVVEVFGMEVSVPCTVVRNALKDNVLVAEKELRAYLERPVIITGEDSSKRWDGILREDR